jgi:hypothetical protein
MPAVADGLVGAGTNALDAAFAAMFCAALDFGFAVGFFALGLDFATYFDDEGPFEEGLRATEFFSF